MAVLQDDVRQVNHGISRGFYATITTNPTNGAVTFGVPKVFTGLRTVNIETTEETNPYYADNVEHIKLRGAKKSEGSLTVYQISEDFLINHLGKNKTAGGALTDTGTYNSFVLGYVETKESAAGVTTEELHVWYNVQASAPTGESKTDEDSAEPKEFEIPVTASPSANGAIDLKTGKPVTELVLVKNSTNASNFELAFSNLSTFNTNMLKATT